MQRWGNTARGTPRFRCRKCRFTGVRQRPDHRKRRWQQRFVSWLTQSSSAAVLSERAGVSRSTTQRGLRHHWDVVPLPQICPADIPVLVLDATTVVKRAWVVLIAQDAQRRRPVSWRFAARESYGAWQGFLQSLEAFGIHPHCVVCDGQKGLLKAVHAVWPEALIQRCLLHVVRQARAWLTQHPKTPAGQALLARVRTLFAVRTKRQRRRWLRAYRSWRRRYEGFLKQRSAHPTEPKRWWYTHRKLRAVHSLIRNSLPDLFTYTRYPMIPRTSNHVEGGINSRLKDLFRCHRGLSSDRKIILTAWYLAARQGQKPTRNDH